MTTFLARLPMATPARFERVRCALARHLYTRRRVVHAISVWLVPKNHPWSVLIRSSNEDIVALTETTLWPRNPTTGKPDVNMGLKHGRAMWRSLVTTALITYLVLDSLSRYVPGPMSYFTVDDQVRIFHRLEAALSAFVGA
jgi:hypothetical protein